MRREMPELRWTAILLGGAVALVLGLLFSIGASASGSELLRAVAVPLGIGGGAAVAGRVAGHAGAFHGGLVAVLWIVSQAIADSMADPAMDPLADAASTVVGDVIRLVIAGIFGFLGARSRR